MRAVLLGTLAAAVALVAAACGSTRTPAAPVNVYVAGKRFASVPLGHATNFLPRNMTISVGHGTVLLHVSDTVANRLVDQALDAHQGRVDLPFTYYASDMQIFALKQSFRHDSEVTSLSMLLSADHLKGSELHLLQQLPRSAPLDRQPIAGSKLSRWGDPERGFVGRPDGAGAQGFGVYEPPILHLAAKYGVHLIDLEGKNVSAVRDAVLVGHPVLAWVNWVGPAAGHSTWLTPSGKKITANLGERAVVLVGAGPGYYLLNDPVSGKRWKWSASRFATRWADLGQRALELP